MTIEILTPPGRIVWGHPLEKTIKTDPKTRKPILKDGKEIDVWAFGLAIPVAQFEPVGKALTQEAYLQYPSGQFPKDFSWKYKVETDTDDQHVPYGQREGYAGHVVLTVSTEAFCPPMYKFENGQYRQVEAREVKCGDWVVSKLSIKGHPGGLYLNPVLHELVGFDKEIVRRSAANPQETFGGRQYQLPPGVSATPVSSAPVGYAMPGQQAAPVAVPGMGYPAAVASQPVYAAAPVAAMPAPAHDFVRNAVGYQQAPQAAPVAVPGMPPGILPGR